MPPHSRRSFRLAAIVLVSIGLALATMPAVAATPSTATRTSALPAVTSQGGDVDLQGDKAQGPAAARRASSAWAGRRILYFETLPAKWDWSLNTAIGKWNGAGGGIRFVRTTSRPKAQLNITYAKIGSPAGLATVGKARNAFVRLNSRYSTIDAVNAHYRVEVMMIFTHELGHVLGFGHTSTKCSLMSPVLDVDGCGMVPASLPGYYKCRAINAQLVARFVRIYGGRARYPANWCPIDPLPLPLTGVDFAGGHSSPVRISWAAPRSVPAGSRVLIHFWQSDECGTLPNWAGTTYVPVDAGAWQDPQVEQGPSCFSVQLVNRYGAGQVAVARMIVV